MICFREGIMTKRRKGPRAGRTTPEPFKVEGSKSRRVPGAKPTPPPSAAKKPELKYSTKPARKCSLKLKHNHAHDWQETKGADKGKWFRCPGSK